MSEAAGRRLKTKGLQVYGVPNMDPTFLVHGWDSIKNPRVHSLLSLSTLKDCQMLPHYDKD